MQASPLLLMPSMRGPHTGAISILVTGNTSEPAAGAILQASGTGSASYGSILIQPSGGAARTISGAATAGTGLVQLNGADYVTFDGLNAGGNSLTIQNTTISSTSGTSTIHLQGDATFNTFTNLNVNGSGDHGCWNQRWQFLVRGLLPLRRARTIT
jgi:hypothetical protein